jgi:hypothetical protein
VAHEPPASQELPDREAVLAACAGIRETYYRDGFGPAMAKFIAIVSHEGPFPDGYADQPDRRAGRLRRHPARGPHRLTVLVNQIENMAVYPEGLLFEPELVVRGSTGRPGTGSVVGALPPFCRQSALVLESASFRTRRHGHPGA